MLLARCHDIDQRPSPGLNVPRADMREVRKRSLARVDQLGGDIANLRQGGVSDPRVSLTESRVQALSKQPSRVLQILLGVGLGSGDAFEGLVEDGNDAPLRRDVRNADMKRFHFGEVDGLVDCPAREPEQVLALGKEKMLQELGQQLIAAYPVHEVLTGRHRLASDCDIAD